MTKKKLKLNACISNGRICYIDDDYRLKINEYKKNNEGANIDVVFESHDRPFHFQYKYLYGYLYVAIAELMGQETLSQYGEENLYDPGIEYIDRVMKEKFLFCEVESWEDIPRKHRSSCRECSIQYQDGNGKTCIKTYGYIPSKAKLNFTEIKNYILQCEMVRDGHEGWSIPEEHIKNMVEIRRRALKK
jgi:hypothetical protein